MQNPKIYKHVIVNAYPGTGAGYILELEQLRKTAKIPQIFSDFYYE